jgi:hypothetical protein
MSIRHEALVVSLVAAFAISLVIAGLVLFNSQTSSPATVTVCPGPPSSFAPPSHLTPANPMILPKCDQYTLKSGNIVFSISAPVDLRGSWVTPDPVAVAVFNTSTTYIANNGWPCPGCYALNGSFNSTLFPGTYEIAFANRFGQQSPVLIATQTIEVVFDRGLDVLQLPMVTNLSAGNYSAWPISAPIGASSFWSAGVIATTGCSYVIAVLPPAVYQQFQVDRAALQSPNATILSSGSASTCPSPPVSTPAPVGPFGPLSITSGDTLVFFNSWPARVQFAVLGPIEISYLTPR